MYHVVAVVLYRLCLPRGCCIAVLAPGDSPGANDAVSGIVSDQPISGPSSIHDVLKTCHECQTEVSSTSLDQEFLSHPIVYSEYFVW